MPLVLNRSFRGVAVSLMVLFSPIYFYKTLMALTGQPRIGLAAVFVYYLSVYVFKFLSNLWAEELSLKLGLKKQIYFGLAFSALSLWLLLASQTRPFWLFGASVFWGLATGFYWFGTHGLMVKLGRQRTFGKQLGILESVNTLFSLLVPFLGGLLISLAGYRALFGVSLLFILASALSLWPLKEVKTGHDTDFGEVWKLFKTHRRAFLTYAGGQASGVIYAVVMPLYLFLILQKELSLGGFFSLSMILVALINLLIGRWVDFRGKKGLMVYGSLFQFFIWLVRSLTKSVSVLFTLDVADQVSGRMVSLPLGVLSYQKAVDGHSTGRALLFRELAITLGGLFTFALLIVWVWLKIDLEHVFWVAAGASLLPLLIADRKHR